jgi:uncharacterized protein
MARLTSPRYLAFPFRVGAGGAEQAERSRHVRDQIEQVLLTNPDERVFRPGFGAGVAALVFEPSRGTLTEVARQRLGSSLAEALQGEVDPRSLTVDVVADGDEVRVVVSYALATIGHVERHEVLVHPSGVARG